MKSSKRRQQASRANGAKSKGPKTAEGKARSSYNSLRHGILSKSVVLACEDETMFEKLLAGFVQRFQPLDEVEFGMIEEMAASHWRMRRGWVAETILMNDAVQKHTDGVRTAEECSAAAFSDLAATPQLALLSRYEGRLSRMYQRALRNLLLLRQQKEAAAQAAAPTDVTAPAASTQPPPALTPVPSVTQASKPGPSASALPANIENKSVNPPQAPPIENFQTNLIPIANTPADLPAGAANTHPSASPKPGDRAA